MLVLRKLQAWCLMGKSERRRSAMVKVISRGYSGGKEKDGCSISLSELSEEELAAVESMLNGVSRLEKIGDRIVATGLHIPPVPPGADDDMVPFWPHQLPGEIQREIFNHGTADHYDPTIYLQGICAYKYTPENYRRQVEIAESYGFICMRSRRGDTGQFWEVWMLHPSAAKGGLEKHIKTLKDRKNLTGKELSDKIMQFLAHRLHFGSYEVVVQKYAMVFDD